MTNAPPGSVPAGRSSGGRLGAVSLRPQHHRCEWTLAALAATSSDVRPSPRLAVDDLLERSPWDLAPRLAEQILLRRIAERHREVAATPRRQPQQSGRHLAVVDG